MTEALEFWKGEFGDEYAGRNEMDSTRVQNLVRFWGQLFDETFGPNPYLRPSSILEIGAGDGANLIALSEVCKADDIRGVEPNDLAREYAHKHGVPIFEGSAAKPGYKAQMVFSSGVLIHIPPDELGAACQGIYDAASHYIVSIEYFADEPEEKLYRGHAGRLWKRDFGAFWLDNFDLEPLGCGFAWRRLTGLDSVTWWAFKKR